MLDKIKNTESLEELQSLYTATFGKTGTMTVRLREMSKMAPDERAELNKENTSLREAFKVRQTELEQAALMQKLKTEFIDVTLDTEPKNHGTLHPLTETLAQIGSILEYEC